MSLTQLTSLNKCDLGLKMDGWQIGLLNLQPLHSIDWSELSSKKKLYTGNQVRFWRVAFAKNLVRCRVCENSSPPAPTPAPQTSQTPKPCHKKAASLWVCAGHHKSLVYKFQNQATVSGIRVNFGMPSLFRRRRFSELEKDGCHSNIQLT